MMACFSSFFIFLFGFILGWHRVACQRFSNITVDDGDAAISYTGSWELSAVSELDVGGRHMIAVHPDASAVFVFQGVAIYFSSPLWPYNVTTQVQLDSGPPMILDLRDVNSPEATSGGPETVKSQIIWGMEGLSDQTHQLKISVAPGDQLAVIDGLIVTVVDKTTAFDVSTGPAGTTTSIASIVATSATTTVTLAATVSPGGGESSDKPVVPIGIGIGIGVGALALLVASVLLYKYCHRRRRCRTSRGTLHLDLENDFPPTIRRPPRCATLSPTVSSPDTSVAGDALIPPLIQTVPKDPSTIQTESKDPSTSLPEYGSLLPPTSSPPTHYMRNALRRITFNRPPPAYHECVVFSRRDTYRMSQLPQSTASSSTQGKF
ncbi:hypothetical protein AGABI2DRAFT_181357 [Agaricus bisporus var. bisporus H97]|uniref:hypothetical protein n=1 Tax=Agaricus bisporus var. bisporus (strain H97 / ATCC MYA-4626 / FGSC 10389) TaxID=936046 RepID=UPI00029F776D|nr:hypothetical protein AGABI2DRAFT_181357 [Agaricus bisporus var. bisporus H97]EKV42607.1 hypothetical protein AGABI2DRAFT_181357 [Agaricus bisporus var. bisporus H97]